MISQATGQSPGDRPVAALRARVGLDQEAFRYFDHVREIEQCQTRRDIGDQQQPSPPPSGQHPMEQRESGRLQDERQTRVHGQPQGLAIAMAAGEFGPQDQPQYIAAMGVDNGQKIDQERQ
jgi:hypothetical protein